MTLALILAQVLRIAVPYLFAAAGGLVSERSGIVALTLEGFMLSGAFGAAIATYYSGSPWLGLVAAVASGALLALVHAVATIRRVFVSNGPKRWRQGFMRVGMVTR